MKKLFTLLFVLLATVGVKAQVEEDIALSSFGGWSWNAEVSTNADNSISIKLTADWGQGSMGWGNGTDWSAYNKLCVVIDSYTNDWGKIAVLGDHTVSEDHPVICEKEFNTITEATTVSVEFDSESAKDVYQLSIQGKSKDDVIKVSRIYLLNEAGDPNVLWEGEHAVNWDNTVKISAAKAANLQVGDIIKFTISNATSDNQAMLKYGWGENDIVLGSNKGYFSSDDTEFLLGVTSSVLAQAKETGIFLTGTGFTVTKAERVEGSGHEKSIWFGRFAMTEAQNFDEFYCPSETGTATQLLINVEGEGSWFQMKNGSWNELTSVKPAFIKTSTGKQYKYLLTDEVKGLLGKFVLQGGGYTVTSIDLDSPTDTWTIAGNSLLVGSDWNVDDSDNAMTSSDGITYTLVKEDVRLEKNTYEYKVVLNNSWDNSNYGDENATNANKNAELEITETAIYKVTFTFNAQTKELTATAEKTGEATPITHTYSVIGTINGSWDTDTEMTEGEDGIYTATFTNVAAGVYKFKVRQDKAWDVAYPSLDYEFSVDNDGSTVVITFNSETKEVNVTVTGTDGISALTIEDSQNAPIFNLAGQRVDKEYKGVVIQNGKKLLVK